LKTARKKVAILIDHSNLKHSWEETNHRKEMRKIDYKKLIRCLSGSDKVLYKVVFLNRDIAGYALCNFFDHSGFETLEKTSKKIMDRKKGMLFKCNMDVDISIVSMQIIFDRALYPVKPDKFVIVSGDSDFELLGHAIIHYGFDVEFAFLKTGFSRELRENLQCLELDGFPIWETIKRNQS